MRRAPVGGSTLGERFHSLRFLTGKSQGNELAIPDPSALVVGRSGNAGVILLDGMVSRTHARFSLNAGSMTVEDLGSANGTFVNGQKIRTLVSLKPGDRILLGATILKLSSAAVSAGTEPTIEVTEEVPAREPGDLSGDLSEVSVVKLLETYALATSDVFLDLRFDGVAGFIAVYRGRIWDCGLDSLPAAPPLKTLLRMLNAARGEYYVRPGGPPESRRVDLDIAALLVEAKRGMDELDILRQRLPDVGASLVLSRPLVAPLVALDETDLSLVQLSHNLGGVERILDQSRLTDVEAVRRLLGLIDRGYLRKG